MSTEGVPLAVDGHSFSVIDVETTGFYSGGADRIVEIAVLRLDADGNVTDELETLVNPQRDLGPTHVHGIRASDVERAPGFKTVAGDVLALMEGTIVVGHNVRFDADFVEAEMHRLGHEVALAPRLCTLRLGYAVGVEPEGRTLSQCCDDQAIPLEGAHSAMADCRATAALLRSYLRMARSQGLASAYDLGIDGDVDEMTVLPELPRIGMFVRRADLTDPKRVPRSALVQVVESLLPYSSANATVAPYIDLLGRVLEDRRVSDEEAAHLLAVAKKWGLSRLQVEEAHRTYLRAVIQVALADSVLTTAEQLDIDAVARALGFGEAAIQELRKEVEAALGRGAALRESQLAESSTPAGLAGKSVCFTGEHICALHGERLSRSQAHEIAAAHGLVIVERVTRKLDLLVVADPHSMSEKARKAQHYGTRVIAEPVFWRMLGVSVA